MKLSVIIPCFNEEKTIIEIINKVKYNPYKNINLAKFRRNLVLKLFSQYLKKNTKLILNSNKNHQDWRLIWKEEF